MKEHMVKKGAIIVESIDDQEHLESLGIVVGAFESQTLTFLDCIVTPEAYEKLKPFRGMRYYWDLVPR